MARNWFARLRERRKAQELPPSGAPAPTQPPLSVALEHFGQTLDRPGDDPHALLAVLLSRDQVEAALGQTGPVSLEDARRLIDLDRQLRQGVTPSASKELSAWRKTFRPPDARWWWFLDQKAEAQEKENDLPWVLLTGVLLTLTLPLALEIFKRLLVGAPDSLSILGTLVTLLLTGSPLSRRGRELAGRFFGRIPRLQPRLHAEAMAGMAGLAFVLVGVGWLLLPRMAVYYNNTGLDALEDGHLTSAQRAFQRAVALDPDLVVPYQNLADVYQRIGRLQDAQTWYQKAIEHDLGFGQAYRGLGHLYNLQGDFAQAEQVLLAGLARKTSAKPTVLKAVTRYQLLSDLGWAYLAQERVELAQDALEEALELEQDIKAEEDRTGTQYRLALPHYTLAQVYERLNRPQDALVQWEDSLRFLDGGNWADRDWITTALEHIEQLEEGQP